MHDFGKIIRNRFIAAAALVAVLFCFYPAYFDDTAAEAETASTGQVVVLYEDNYTVQSQSVNKLEKHESAESAQEKILDEALDDNYTIDDTIVLNASDESEEEMVLGVISSDDLSTEELVDVLQSADGIRYAEPNLIFRANAYPDWNDTYIKDSWQLGEKGINVDKAPASNDSGNPVVLAVMDSGIAYDHPDLESRMWTAPAGLEIGGEHGADFVDYDDDPYDEDGHGTHCAGIIAAAADNSEGIAGVTGGSNAQLMSVRVLGEDGGDLSGIIKAFDYLIEAKKQNVNIRAVNCSFGVDGKSSILDSVIDRAGENGILTIAAAGNESLNNDENSYIPCNSNSQYVISVAATDDSGNLSSYSNYGRNNVDVAAPGSNILSSVSYINYTPYLYSAARVKDTSQFYGEFDGAEVFYDAETGSNSVIPVPGTGYDGNAVTGVDSFGASKMYSILKSGSSGYADISITSGSEEGSFQVGNNQKSLRWTIKDAGYGDTFILYFPYIKNSDDPYVSLVIKTFSNYPENADGDLFLGDIVIEKDSESGEVQYQTSSEESGWILNTDRTYNSLWRASGEQGVLYDMASVNGVPYGSYGLGLIYRAWDDGDFYVDISSLAISSGKADEASFGCYDVYSGTSMAAPVVTGSIGIIAAAKPELSAAETKTVLLSTTKADGALSDKCLTGAKVDFSAYSDYVPPQPAGGADFVIDDRATEFVWSGKSLTSKVYVLIHSALSGSKTPKSFSVKTKKNKAALKWKKVKGIDGYIVFRKTGKGRFVQIATLSSGKKSYTDKTVKKGKKYQYLIVSYRNIPDRNAVQLSPASKIKKFKR